MAIIQNYKINLVIMITYVLMMMITEFLVINTSKWWDPFVSIPFNTLFLCSCFMGDLSFGIVYWKNDFKIYTCSITCGHLLIYNIKYIS